MVVRKLKGLVILAYKYCTAVIMRSVSTNEMKNIVQVAFAEYKKKTCIRFRPKNKDDQHYIHFVKEDGYVLLCCSVLYTSSHLT